MKAELQNAEAAEFHSARVGIDWNLAIIGLCVRLYTGNSTLRTAPGTN